ncbi:AAA family ATPase [Marinobacter sp. C2H3]|uniref:AAA family ATPase n=1 Tax=Marinobacter sp. C2H3 TaxID=3119003 RepID=UPI00300F178A
MTQAVHHTRTLAITGGKGGVGKTSVALNLALSLGSQGQRVLLLDADMDLANVSILMGLYPQRTLADVIRGDCRIDDILLEAPFGVHIVPGASGVQECLEMSPAESLGLLRALGRLEARYDYVIIDTPAGLQSAALHTIASAELACVVVTPDPASLTDAFSLIKVLRRRGYRRQPSILVNMAQGASQARSVYQRLDAAARKHQGEGLHYLGAIWRDETLRQSVLNQRPVALLPASDPSCRQFHTLVDMLDVRLSQLPPRKAGLAAYWHSVSRRQGDRPESALAVRPATSEPPAAPRDRGLAAVDQLAEALAQSPDDAMLRYEAFNRFFALLGGTFDADALEILQTGLASLPWEQLPEASRLHFARHLTDLADQRVVPPAPARPSEAVPPASVAPGSAAAHAREEPVYDRFRFGEQDRLVRVLREQPADISLDQLLRSLVTRGPDNG